MLRQVVAWQLRHFPTFLPLHPFQGTTREHGSTALYAQFLDGLRGQTLPFFLEVPVAQRYVPHIGRIRQLQQARSKHIPLKRSAYSSTSLLIAVSFDWTEFATSTRPKSLAVWNPINGSVCAPLWHGTSPGPLSCQTRPSHQIFQSASPHLMTLSVWPCQPVTVKK